MRIAIPFIVVAVVLAINFLVAQRTIARYDYECGNCHQRWSLSLAQAAFAPHRLGMKSVRCPSCGERTWATRVPKAA